MTTSKTRLGQRGFVDYELLLPITIVGILAGIFLPVLAHVYLKVGFEKLILWTIVLGNFLFWGTLLGFWTFGQIKNYTNPNIN